MSTDAVTALALHNPETNAFWAGLIEGRFLVRRCEDCGEAHWYPRAICPFCSSSRTGWQEASGRGVIYSYSIMRRAKVPYAIAFVSLAEGPTMMTNIVDCDFEALAIGQPVKLAIRRREDGLALPMFTPA
ncbi:Zn-ribbon domain-containing OB-fold protein [Bosea caraganae]|uniref:Zn-ribbon domain-containing OB-fold protein n=1 Tax=Bosea caraganae TaxID=2763117 RepID=A0A370KXU5_9HYPH|nr:Zn-ribbon domain-containing OB-fold protein [Bosea caraganae]RDJ19776.1 Zn-ribbon domain-containing OB-fold protein [Bosea caraganae]RDJ21121.1 Zn-ribbon domain-containing OB-fold protein [Bosea caraganae]